MGSLYAVVQLQNISYCWQQQNVRNNSTYPDAGYPDRLGPSGKSVDNSTKLACLEITGYRIKNSAVLWLLELQIKRGRRVQTQVHTSVV
jgi:hypothetical protein